MPIRCRYYTRWTHKRQVLESGAKPSRLPPGISPQRAWARCLNRREPVNPIHVARRFEQQYRTAGFDNYTAVAEHFDVTRPVVCYYLSLLHRLPVDFVRWLESSTDNRAAAFFTERRLRPVTRVTDLDAQQRRLRELIAEYQDGADVSPNRR